MPISDVLVPKKRNIVMKKYPWTALIWASGPMWFIPSMTKRSKALDEQLNICTEQRAVQRNQETFKLGQECKVWF